MLELSEVWFAGYARMPDERLKELVRASEVAPLRIQYDPVTSCVVIGSHYYPAEGVARMTRAPEMPEPPWCRGELPLPQPVAPAPKKRRGRPPKDRTDAQG